MTSHCFFVQGPAPLEGMVQDEAPGIGDGNPSGHGPPDPGGPPAPPPPPPSGFASSAQNMNPAQNFNPLSMMMEFGSSPMSVTCPNCSCQVITMTKKQLGPGAYFFCTLMCCLG